MLPPSGLRRLLLVPLVVVIATALAVLTPPVAVLSVAYQIVKRWTRPSRPRRMRALRVTCFALVWSVGETAALMVCACLWIVSGFGGRLATEPYQSRHYGVMRWFLDLIYHAAQRTCGLRVEVTGPAQAHAQARDPRPLIVLSRHAGPGTSLLLVHHLLTEYGRRPRVVMKATLQLDPVLDILANRLPNAFVRRRAGSSHHAELIRRLAAGLDPQGALVLFPEGGNWTPLRWRRTVDRLRRQGDDNLAERAVAMPNVLAPRGGGVLAAIAACPTADVIFVAHTGLDRLVSVRDVWRGLSADLVTRARWWRVPAAEVPRTGGREAQVAWLYDNWQRIDAWITTENAGQTSPLTTTHPSG
jgi:1-acyl-sn-glycerol-3-phosphate acyltransferase